MISCSLNRRLLPASKIVDMTAARFFSKWRALWDREENIAAALLAGSDAITVVLFLAT